MGQDWKSFEVHVRKSQDYLKRFFGRNTEDASGEASSGNEEHVVGL